ncbi:Pathogenesis-related protein 1 [Sarcoptes scabiei]|uniref:Pathogenesis-related protein 1 n=2 Tax=Sarcoptes scabiei TaxID=52283 RepID=A0A834VFZ3_SARSC|nr:Pathogenesis-related protein 1 [Sarcoptes scabiei]
MMLVNIITFQFWNYLNRKRLYFELERIARYRAIELAKKDGTNFYHHDHMDVGENLAWNSQEPIDCRIPLQLWYDEWKIYNYQHPKINPQNGHFTQMIWRSSRRIGCGQAISKGRNGGTYTVCNYDPPGNWKNEELQNVSPPLDGVGIEWNPLGKNTIIQMPPIDSSSTILTTKLVKKKATRFSYKKLLPKLSTTYSNYYYGPKTSLSTSALTNYKYKLPDTYRSSPKMTNIIG